MSHAPVRTAPHSTRTTSMSDGRSSSDNASPTTSNAAFAALYQPVNGRSVEASIDEMLIRRPGRPSARSRSTARRLRRAGPITDDSNWARISSSSTSMIPPSWAAPALCTTMPGRCRSTMRAAARASSRSRRSTTSEACFPWDARTAASASSLRTVATTVRPRSRSAATMASPIPEFAPVTSALGGAPIGVVVIVGSRSAGRSLPRPGPLQRAARRDGRGPSSPRGAPPRPRWHRRPRVPSRRGAPTTRRGRAR